MVSFVSRVLAKPKGDDMTKLEIACVIVGLIGVLCSQSGKVKGETKDLVLYIVHKLIFILVFGAMVLLPLYFRYWR